MWNEFCKIKTSAECLLHNKAIISLKWGLSHYQFDDWCEWSYLILVNWNKVSDIFSFLAPVRKAPVFPGSISPFTCHLLGERFTVRSTEMVAGLSERSISDAFLQIQPKEFSLELQSLSPKDGGREEMYSSSGRGCATEDLLPLLPAQLFLPGAPCELVSRAGCWPGRTLHARSRRALRKGWFHL